MTSEPADPPAEAAIDALRDILDAVTEVAERLFGVPDGTVARCPQ